MPYKKESEKDQIRPAKDRVKPRNKASFTLIFPDGRGLLAVRAILASISRSSTMFNTVLPLIAKNRLPANPRKVCRVITGHLALIYPVRPVIRSRPVWRLFISGR
jgi:hypothetical protein